MRVEIPATRLMPHRPGCGALTLQLAGVGKGFLNFSPLSLCSEATETGAPRASSTKIKCKYLCSSPS